MLCYFLLLAAIVLVRAWCAPESTLGVSAVRALNSSVTLASRFGLGSDEDDARARGRGSQACRRRPPLGCLLTSALPCCQAPRSRRVCTSMLMLWLRRRAHPM